MYALSSSDIVIAWETGREQHPVDRALLLLALTCPEMSPTERNALTVGQRNARLLTLRQKTLGTLANCFMTCPQCHEQLEFTIDIDAIRQPEPVEQVGTLALDNFNLSFRLPNSIDLAAVANSVTVQEGRLLLLERCVQQAKQDAQAITAINLPEHVIQALAEAMVEKDPQAEMDFALDCPACKHNWTTVFDIVSFFWTEIEALARRLLSEVHTLASAYGWREVDILALSPTRRQFYLELIH